MFEGSFEGSFRVPFAACFEGLGILVVRAL